MWCLNCCWDEGTCDLHHIKGRKVENADTCHNITLICPNCHRLIHEGKLDVLTLKTLAQHLKESDLSYLII
jgi:predicted HNH restriction endonuclease